MRRLWTSGTSLRAFADDPYASLSPQLLQTDLDWMLATLAEVGAKPFAFCDETAFRASAAATRAANTTPLNPWQYWLRVGALFQDLHDGHMSVGPYTLFRNWVKAGGRTIALGVAYDGDALVVSDAHGTSIPAYARVVAIAGLAEPELSNELLSVTTGPNAVFKRMNVRSSFYRFVMARFGARASYRVDRVAPRLAESGRRARSRNGVAS